MPCRCEGYDDAGSDELQRELDRTTQSLCFLCGQIEGAGSWNLFGNSRIEAWWKHHLANDTKRVKHAVSQMLEQHNGTISANNIAIVLIREAEKVHPVSEWHKEWFQALADQGKTQFDADRAKAQQLKTSIADKLSTEEIEFNQH